MSATYAGALGSTSNSPIIDEETNCINRSWTTGPICATRDPNTLDRAGYVWDAWELAKSRYAAGAIIDQTEREFYELIRGTLPGVVVAFAAIISTTVIGGLIGLAIGGNFVAGATIGLVVGLAIFRGVGLGFLLVYLAEHVADIGLQLWTGARIAWDSRGGGAIDIAAKEMAKAIGIFYAAVIQGFVMFLTAAIAEESFGAALKTLKNSKFIQQSASVDAWIAKNLPRLSKKYSSSTNETVVAGEASPTTEAPLKVQIEWWFDYMNKLELRAPRDRGMLWSKLATGDAAPAMARKLAQQHNLECLETLLDRTEFQAIYDSQFTKADKEATFKIWQSLSAKYASNLEGRVTVFIDKAKFNAAIAKAGTGEAIPPLNLAGEAGAKIVNEFWAKKLPFLSGELDVITDIMIQNNKVTSVVAIDVATDEVVFVMSADVVRAAAKSGPH